MNTLSNKTEESKSQSASNALSQKRQNSESSLGAEDIRPEAIAQRKLLETVGNSLQMKKEAQLLELANNNSMTTQLKAVRPDGVDGGGAQDKEVWLTRDGKGTGKEYNKTIDGAADGRLKAMVVITKYISSLMTQDGIPHQGDEDKWTSVADDLNKPAVDTVDPFRVKISHYYRVERPYADEFTVPISASVHVGRYKPGYIIEQTDGDDMGQLDTLTPRDEVTGYAEDHVQGDGAESVYSKGTEKKDGKLTAAAWDERSKIIGEGWRFEPVLELAEKGKLHQDSKFYEKVNPLEARDGEFGAEKTLYSYFGKLAQAWGKIHGMPNKPLTKAQMAANQKTKAKEFSKEQLTNASNKPVKVLGDDVALTDKDYNLGA